MLIGHEIVLNISYCECMILIGQILSKQVTNHANRIPVQSATNTNAKQLG